MVSDPVVAQESAPASVPQLSGADQEARALFMAAQVAFDEGRFESAVQYFEQSYRLSNRPELLYNIGNTYDRLQRPEQALQYFDQYLRERPNAENHLQVEARARLLRQSLDARRAPGTSDEVTPPTVATTVPTPEQTAQAHVATESTPVPTAPRAATVADEGGSSSWMLWTGIGAAVVAATVVGVVLATSGSDTTQPPLVPRADAAVVRL